MDQFVRTELLLGKEAMEKLKNARIAVFGVGGVGGYAVEALARSGVGALDLVDDDRVCATNINRQIIAHRKTIGQYKVDAWEERISDIHPGCRVYKHRCFYLPEMADQFDFSLYDYVLDAVDTVTAKIDIVLQAQRAGAPVISSMGAGNKLQPGMMEVADIYETSVCPLARVMRRELKKRGVPGLKVVYSREQPLVSGEREEAGCISRCVSSTRRGEQSALRRGIPGSVSFVPAVAGLMMAGEVIRDLAEINGG